MNICCFYFEGTTSISMYKSQYWHTGWRSTCLDARIRRFCFFLLLFLCNMPCRVKEHGSKRVSVTRQSEQDTQGVHQQARGFSQATVEPSVQHPTMTVYSWITGLQKCLEKTFIVSSDLSGSDAVHLWCRRRSLTYVFRHSFLTAELNSICLWGRLMK